MQKEAVYLCHQRDDRVANAAPDHYVVEKYAANLVNKHTLRFYSNKFHEYANWNLQLQQIY